MNVQFEYDPNKSKTNKLKHGIDFEEAQEIWNDVHVVVPLGNKYGEERLAVFGMIDLKHWTAIITYRGDSTRLISVRRSRKNEEEYYDRQKNNLC